MAIILIISPDEGERKTLDSAVRNMGHIVSLADRLAVLPILARSDLQTIEIVVCDVTALDEPAWRELRAFAVTLRQRPTVVLMLCYSRIYRGPRFELDVERLGARFVYA